MPATLTTDSKRRKAFSKALQEALELREISQAALGEALGDLRQSTVCAWVNGHALPPDVETVFWIEEELDLAPGHLSRLLGFLPSDDDVEVDVVAAVMSDPQLTPTARRAVLEVYDDLKRKAKKRHPSAHKAKVVKRRSAAA